jgi:hypothetical protein
LRFVVIEEMDGFEYFMAENELSPLLIDMISEVFFFALKALIF